MGGESPTKKMVKRVKEIVHDFSDEEIHAMLEECDMDPNEAVQRLLVQDTFHEVKSKRDRRRKVKGTQELGKGNISNCGANANTGYKNETGYVASSLSRPSYAFPFAAKGISKKSGHMSASVHGENRNPTRARNVIKSPMQSTKESNSGLLKGGRKTSTVANVKVSPRWAEARSYLQDMQQSERYNCGQSKTDSGSGGASDCSMTYLSRPLLIVKLDATKIHGIILSAAYAPVRAMSISSESDHTSSEASDKVEGGVLLPNHVKALAAECLNLTFGTYNTCSSSTNSVQRKSDPSAEADGQSLQQLYLQEHLLNEILEPDNNFSGGNLDKLLLRESKNQPNTGTPFGFESEQNKSDSISKSMQYTRNSLHELPSEEVPSYSSDLLKHLKSGSSTQSSPQFLRQQDIFNSTYPPDKARYNAAVSYMKSQTISIPEKILGDDHDHPAAIKLPGQLFSPPSQHNHTVDGLGCLGVYSNTPQNYEHKLYVEHLLQYMTASINGHGVPHPLNSLAPSSINASRFGSSTNSRGSSLPNASLAVNAPSGFQTQIKDCNPFPGQIESNTSLDYVVRFGPIRNAQEQHVYGSSVEAREKYRYLGSNDLLSGINLNLSLKPNNWRPNY